MPLPRLLLTAALLAVYACQTTVGVPLHLSHCHSGAAVSEVDGSAGHHHCCCPSSHSTPSENGDSEAILVGESTNSPLSDHGDCWLCQLLSQADQTVAFYELSVESAAIAPLNEAWISCDFSQLGKSFDSRGPPA